MTRVEGVEARDEGEHQRKENAAQAEDALRFAVQQAYLDVGKGVLDRSLARANFVTAAGGTIGTLYTGLLALVFASQEGHAASLPPSGLVPAVFLGLASALSATYVGFLKSGEVGISVLPKGSAPALQEERLISFLGWVAAGAIQRAWALRIAVICLGLGVALIPLPFLNLALGQTKTVRSAAFGLLGASLAYEVIAWWRSRRLLRPDLPPPGSPEPPRGAWQAGGVPAHN